MHRNFKNVDESDPPAAGSLTRLPPKKADHTSALFRENAG